MAPLKIKPQAEPNEQLQFETLLAEISTLFINLPANRIDSEIEAAQSRVCELLDDLKDYKFGATRGYTYTKEFWQAIESKRLKVDVTDNDMQNFKNFSLAELILFHPV